MSVPFSIPQYYFAETDIFLQYHCLYLNLSKRVWESPSKIKFASGYSLAVLAGIQKNSKRQNSSFYKLQSFTVFTCIKA